MATGLSYTAPVLYFAKGSCGREQKVGGLVFGDQGVDDALYTESRRYDFISNIN
jgi:hypothetical protein